MRCHFVEYDVPNEKGKRRCQCARCGLRTAPTSSRLDKIYAECRFSAVGDWLAWLLVAVGITASRYVAAKRLLYHAMGWREAAEKAACGCSGRQDWLNDLTWPWVRWLTGR